MTNTRLGVLLQFQRRVQERIAVLRLSRSEIHRRGGPTPQALGWMLRSTDEGDSPKAGPCAWTLVRLAQALETTPGWLLGGGEE